MSETDHELMERWRHGDAAAFETLVRRWEGRLGRMLRPLVGCTDDVDDLCQEVFLRVHTARNRYRPQGAFSTWLYSIALNLARDRARRRRWLSEPLGNHQPQAPAGEPQRRTHQQELAEKVEAALGELPTELREVLVLKQFGELTFAEVADATGLPASTVKSRVRAALERLRRQLLKRGIDERELEP